MNTRVSHLLGDAYTDYMGSHSATPPIVGASATGFWSAVGNILSNRGVVQVETKKSDPTMNYLVLGAVGLGMLFVAAQT